MKKLTIAVALGATIVGTQALAQQAQIPPAAPVAQGSGSHMHADRTRQQAQQMASTMFQRFDLNGDGVLTRDEAQQALSQSTAARGGEAGEGERGGGRAQRMLARMFGDSASVTLAQFENQALARFDREDIDRNGVVTSAERQQARANRGQ
ncbi:EF hand domain-containing protein [Sphingomonas sp. F9_3S_D5_B_2]